MTWAEIAALFVAVEELLTRSLRRNLKGHKEWEEKKGLEWSAWQAEKLAGMKAYREQNEKIMKSYKRVIRTETEQMLMEQYREGREGSFFAVNDKRMDRLLEDILGREERAETAALRMMDDVYRQTVYKAEIAMAAGASTLPQAIDMAVEDYLRAGINCIVYKNGSRHNIADYAFMALQTAAIRAYLQGEAKKRERLGIDTVLVSQYGGCSNTCLPWQGRVYIDDVFGSFHGETDGERGKSSNGKWYPLLSVAVAAGLFHPNCRHTLSTWYEGITTLPEPLPEEEVKEHNRLEQKQRLLEKKVREAKRRYEFETDPEVRAKRKKEVRDAQAQVRDHVNAHEDLLRRDYWREKTHSVSNVAKSEQNVILSEEEEAATIRYIGGGCHTFNAKLRAGLPLTEDELQWMVSLDQALKKLPDYQGVVTRDLRFMDTSDMMDYFKTHQLGTRVTERDYTSATVFPSYQKNPHVRISINAKKAKDLRQYNIGEGEVLFPRETNFEVIDIHKEHGIVYVEMEESE